MMVDAMSCNMVLIVILSYDEVDYFLQAWRPWAVASGVKL